MDTDPELDHLVDLFGNDDVAAAIALFAPETFMLTPKGEDKAPAPAPKGGAPKGPSYPTKMKPGPSAGGFDPKAHPRGSAGTPKGGQFIPKNKGGGGAGKKAAPAKKGTPGKKAAPPKQSKSQRVAHLMEGILKALGPLMAELSGPQVQALMEKIKKNAEAFINGQANAPHHGGGGHKGGGGASKTPPGKKGAPSSGPAGGGKSTPSSSGTGQSPGGGGGKSGGGGDAALIKSVINSVKGLLKGFGQQMKPEQRTQLQKAIRGLENMAAVEAEMVQLANSVSANPSDPTICVMAIPHEDAVVHYIGPEEKHATMLYLGSPSDNADPQRMLGSKALLQGVVKQVADSMQPFTADVTGVEPLGDAGAQVWKLSSPEMQDARDALLDTEVVSMYEDADITKYPDFTPHVTVGYQGAEDEPETSDEDLQHAQDIVGIPFDRLALWWGNERHEYPLGG